MRKRQPREVMLDVLEFDGKRGDATCFDQPMRVNLFRKAD